MIADSIAGQTIELLEFEILEVVGFQITRGFDPINLFSVYLPTMRSTNNGVREELMRFFSLINTMEGEIIVGADFNAHHVTWSPEFPTCSRGKMLNEMIEDSQLIMLNGGCNTMVNPPGSKGSAIYLSLATAGLTRKITWTVQEEEFGSIHLTILLEVSSTIPIVERTITRVNQNTLVKELNGIRPQYIYSPEEMVAVFDEAIEKASFSFKNKKANYLKSWWTDEIANLYASKREALRGYNRNQTDINYVRLKKERARFKREVRRTKRKYVREMTEKIDVATPARQLWNIVKGIDTALAGNHKKGIELTHEEGRKFMDHYFGNKFQEVSFPKASTEETLGAYEMTIRERELQPVLQTRKSYSAPGLNGMSYAVLKQLNPDMQGKIFEILSKVFVSEKIPDQWRKTKVRPFRKKHGSLNNQIP